VADLDSSSEDRRAAAGVSVVATSDLSEDKWVAVGSSGVVVVVVDSSSSEDRRVEVRWWSEGKQAAVVV
jgi:hypothetical protein